jgi:hypothetical protein
MGFWDFLTGDTKDVNGSGPPPTLEPMDTSPDAPKVARSAPPPAASVPPKTSAPPPAKTATPEPPPLAYGIDKANELMDTIDVDDDPAPVVRVIRKTLESVGVSIPELVADARRRETDLRDNIAKRRATIADLERQIQVERTEIAALEASLSRTGKTRGHLELAEQNRTRMQPAFTGAPPPLPEEARPTIANEAKPKQSAPPPPLPSKAPAKPNDVS